MSSGVTLFSQRSDGTPAHMPAEMALSAAFQFATYTDPDTGQAVTAFAALTSRVRVDVAQSYTAGQKAQGRANLTAAASGANGDITDLLGVGGTGIRFRGSSTTLASAATVDLGSAPTRKVTITGTTAITSLGSVAHAEVLVRFSGALTLTHNATSLVLPGAANLLTVAGDTAIFTSDASGNWRCHDYSRADGTPLALPTMARQPSFRRRCLNGDFSVNQRSVSGTVTLAAGQYGHDGWKAGAAGCTYTFARSGGVTTLTITAGSLLQIIEGTLYLTEGGTYTLAWIGTATARINSSSAAYAASPITATGLVADANATVEFGPGTLSLVQLEPGSTATPFEVRDDELRRCQRYAISLTDVMGLGGICYNATSVQSRFSFPVEMRANPTASVYTAGNWNISDDYTTDFTAATVSIVQVLLRRRGGRIFLGGFTGLTAGRYYGSIPGGTAVILASAEL